jgi:threonine dehydrogenase-like Zn-dependent dehydrogenase
VNPRSNDPVGAISDLTHGGADFTLDTSSQPEGRIAGMPSAKVWGTVCFVGERNNVTIDVSPDMLRKQLTIIGSWTFSWQARPTPRALSSSARSMSSGSSPTAGSSTRPKRPIVCSTPRRPARAYF